MQRSLQLGSGDHPGFTPTSNKGRPRYPFESEFPTMYLTLERTHRGNTDDKPRTRKRCPTCTAFPASVADGGNPP